MIKKSLISLILILLSSCFSDSNVDTSWNDAIQSIYENINFSMKIPSKWELIKDFDTILPKPSNWSIVLSSVSPNINENFYRNILILKQELNTNINSLDFTIWNYISSKGEYYYSKLFNEKNVLIDSKKTKIYEFEAKYSEDTSIFKFLQTWIVCDNNAFLITIALEKNNLNIDRYEWLLASFKCKNIENN